MADEKENFENAHKLLKQYSAEEIFEVLKSEEAHTIFLCLSVLEPRDAVFILEKLPVELKVRVGIDLLYGESVSVKILDLVCSDVISKILANREKEKIFLGGLEFASDLYCEMDSKSEKEIIDSIKKIYPNLYKELIPKYVGFQMLKYLTDKSIQTLLIEIDLRNLVYALKGEEPELIEKFSRNMSANNKKHFLAELNSSEPLNDSTRYVVQNKIKAIAKRLLNEGYIEFDHKYFY